MRLAMSTSAPDFHRLDMRHSRHTIKREPHKRFSLIDSFDASIHTINACICLESKTEYAQHRIRNYWPDSGSEAGMTGITSV